MERPEITLRRARSAIVVAVVAGATLLVFWPVGRFPFVSFDDGVYVFENDPVRGGLTAAGLRWAFTTFYETSWQPLAWMSHMLDVQLFGLNPGAHHLSSLTIHLATSLLLLAVLSRLTGRLWRSAMVSLLFAVHPLHVESVVWVSERKDVLSALLWMLTLAAYLRYLRKPGAPRYALVVGVYILGLMAKPMLVTLPLVLLLLDYWPLGRVDSLLPGKRRTNERPGTGPPRLVLLEKLPLLIPALAASVVTLVIQPGNLNEENSLALSPLTSRFANAAVTYGTYLLDMVWPQGLAYFYPFPGDGQPVPALVAAVLTLAGFTLWAIRQGWRRPYVLVGWGWYLVTLLPVIGIVEVGLQEARADRYTYLPLIGMFVLLVWVCAGLAPRRPGGGAVLCAAGGIVTLLCAVLARRQVGYWRDFETLNRHAIAVTSGNWIAQVNLGSHLLGQGRTEEGLGLYREVAQSVPARAERHFRSAISLAGQGRDREASVEYRRATEFYPPFAKAHFHFGLLRARQGYWEDAAAAFAEALNYQPDHPEARYNLEIVLEGLGYEPGSLEGFLRNEQRPSDRGGGRAR